MADQNKFEVLGEVGKSTNKVMVTEAAEEQIPRVERKIKQIWMTEDILDLMKKLRQVITIRKSGKNVMKPNRSGSMTSEESEKHRTIPRKH